MKKLIYSIYLTVVVIITFFSFYPSLDNGFTSWDDDKYITENTLIRNLSRDSIFSMFNIVKDKMYFDNSFAKNMYIPFVFLSYSIEYHFFKLAPEVYHKTNLLFHTLNSLLVFLFVFLIMGKIECSFIVSLLFAIHPIHVESVAWLSERKDVLYTFFYILSIICYYYYREGKEKFFYYFSLILFLFSMFSKTMAMTLPGIIILIDCFKGLKIDKKTLIEKIPFILIASSFIFVTFIFTDMKMTLGYSDHPVWSFEKSISIMSFSIMKYIERMFIPKDLSCLYPFPGAKMNIIRTLSPLILIIFASFTYIIVKGKRNICFGVLFFIITISPVTQLIPLPPGITPDRYTYVPFIGLFMIFADIIERLYADSGRKLIKSLIIVLLVIIFIIFSYMTWKRCEIWKNSETLWNDVLSKYPEIADAYINRGLYYFKNKKYQLAINDYQKAMETDYANARTYMNLGDLFTELFNYEKAIAFYSLAIKYDNKMVHAIINRGNAYRFEKKYDEAVSDYDRALEINALSQDAYLNRGIIHIVKGNFESAVSDFTKALSIDPYDTASLINRGIAFQKKKQYDKALRDYDKALSIERMNAMAYYNRGILFMEINEYDKAENDFTNAIIMIPDYIDAIKCRIYVYCKKGHYQKASLEIMRLKRMGYPMEEKTVREISEKLMKHQDGKKEK